MSFSVIKHLPFLLITGLLSCQPSNKVGGLVGVDENPSFENTWWELTSYDGKPPRTRATIKFNDPEHMIEAFTGCNKIQGSYQKNGADLKISPMSEQKQCPGKMEAESAFIGILQMTDNYELTGRQLFLKNGGKVIAFFTFMVRKQI